MAFKDINNNKNIYGQLSAMVACGKIPQALMFVGGQESRLEMGRETAKAILCVNSGSCGSSESPGSCGGSGHCAPGDSCGHCLSCRKFDHDNHEDFIFMNLENSPGSARTQIGVESVLYIQEQLKLKPYGKRHVVLLDEAHLLNIQAQNKLLKTLEEPSGDSVIILLTEKKDALLPTVLSRCSCFFLEDEAVIQSGPAAEIALRFALLCAENAPFYRKKECIKEIIEDKENSRALAMEFVSALEVYLRDAAVTERSRELKPLGGKAIDIRLKSMDFRTLKQAVLGAEEAARALKAGYNTGYTLKKLCLCI